VIDRELLKVPRGVVWTRRDVLKASLVLSGATLIPSCGFRRKLRVANWADLIAPDTVPRFAREFGCEVIYENYSSNEELAAKLRDPRHGYDVVFPSDYMVERLRKEGLLAKLSPEMLPNLRNLDETLLDKEYDPGNGFCVPYTYWGTGLAVNSARFPGDPSVGGSWVDLERPEANGRITLLDEMRYTLGLGLIMNGYSVNSRSRAEIDSAAAAIISLKPRLMAFVTDVIDLLVAGDPALSYAYSGDVFQAASANPEVRFEVPEGGGIVGIDNACITRASGERELAHLFLNYLMRSEVAAAFTKHTFYATPNRAAKEEGLIPSELLHDPAIFLPLDGDLNVLRDLGDANDMYASAWERVKAA